jgi:hypothetical protein
MLSRSCMQWVKCILDATTISLLRRKIVRGEEITKSQHIWCRICEVVVEGAGMKDEHLYLQPPWQFSGLAQLPSQLTANFRCFSHSTSNAAILEPHLSIPVRISIANMLVLQKWVALLLLIMPVFSAGKHFSKPRYIMYLTGWDLYSSYMPFYTDYTQTAQCCA